MPDATNPREIEELSKMAHDITNGMTDEELESFRRNIKMGYTGTKSTYALLLANIDALRKENASLREQRERILARQKDYESALTRACERGDTYKSEYERLLEQRKRVLELCDELVYYGAELGRQKRRYVRVSKIRAALEEKP